MKKLTFSIMLLAICAFATSVHAQDDFTKGNSYHLIFLDATSGAKIPAANIAHDFRVDDTNNFLYIWSSTYNDLGSSGPNSEGEIESYINLSVASVGWSGFGFSGPVAKDMTAVTSNYTLHIAMKATNSASHIIGMDGPGGLTARICIGSTAFVDGANVYQPYTNFTRDNKWHVIEIPMSAFFNLGLRYPEAVPANANVLYVLSGGVSGTAVTMDAIYVYNKNTTGINDVKDTKLDVLISSKTLSVVGATQPIELYSITGSKIRTSNENIMDIEGIQKGIYIVRCGQLTNKVEIR
ncbi:MAG: hypothetical protein ACYC25_15400 [Paludibacter sp.]